MNLERADLLANIDHAALQALVEGRHGDPFTILGRHPVGNTNVVRAFLPGATSVEVIDTEGDSVIAQME
ncbi:GlgB N-terminal domain-containing protein, partial [Tritonibacter sp. SIMBA_163]|uniref:GlgB N-terminal domain-containing protein n=1 Tax=Tritonibacter sp. SIMBA_163 TaxID=3080868 RepID=UPI003980FD67